MSYHELIKNFDHIRGYMRDFYIYGFRSREEYVGKSARTYDNEKRRLESWLGDCMAFQRTAAGKSVFISVDTRHTEHNPLYQAWKAKSFTDGDITLHFLLLDLLADPGVCMTLQELLQRLDRDYLAKLPDPPLFDESTVRKKLNAYVRLGLLCSKREGRQMVYHRAIDPLTPDRWREAVAFFSEADSLGVVGSFLLDKWPATDSPFAFKHHYITQAMDSEILCSLLLAMSEKREVVIHSAGRHSREQRYRVVPLRIFVSVQSGRRYLMAYCTRRQDIHSFRLDYIREVSPGEPAPAFDKLCAELTERGRHMWGVDAGSSNRPLEHVEFDVHVDVWEPHIPRRLEREKRCGQIDQIDAYTWRFIADVYDTEELFPWIRTFIGRIQDIRFSNRAAEQRFLRDLRQMASYYGEAE